MATLDGYAPFASGLSAEEIVWALKRSYNLDVEFINYPLRTIDNVIPTSAVALDVYTDNERNYVAHVEGRNYLWIEI